MLHDRSTLPTLNINRKNATAGPPASFIALLLLFLTWDSNLSFSEVSLLHVVVELSRPHLLMSRRVINEDEFITFDSNPVTL